MSCRNCKYAELEDDRCYCKKKSTLIKRYKDHQCSSWQWQPRHETLVDESVILKYVNKIEDKEM